MVSFNVCVLFKGEMDNILIKGVHKISNNEDYFVVETEKESYYFRWYDDKVKAVFIGDKDFGINER